MINVNSPESDPQAQFKLVVQELKQVVSLLGDNYLSDEFGQVVSSEDYPGFESVEIHRFAKRRLGLYRFRGILDPGLIFRTPYVKACHAVLSRSIEDSRNAVCNDAERRFMNSSRNGRFDRVFTSDGKIVAFSKNFGEDTTLALEDFDIVVEGTSERVHVPKGSIADIDTPGIEGLAVIEVGGYIFPHFNFERASSFALPHNTYNGPNNLEWLGAARDLRGLDTMRSNVDTSLAILQAMGIQMSYI